MKTNAAFFIALRYLWARAHEGARFLRGAAAGIAVSLVPIIVTLIVADGMIRGILDRFIELGTAHLQVFNVPDNEIEDTVERINQIEGIRGVWPERRGMGVLAGRTGRTGVSVRAVDPSFWDDSAGAQFLIVIDGEHSPQTDRDIVLGQTLAENIGASVGDTVRLMTVRDTDAGFRPRMAPFTVRGIMTSGYNELDALWCIISFEGGRRVFAPENTQMSLLVKIDSPYREVENYLFAIHDELDGRFSVFTWKDLLRSQYRSYQTSRQLLLFIMALIVIVAAVNVSSATSMLALERRKDIAVLKVTGGTVRGVTGIFLWGGFLTGLVGSIIGIGVGLLIGSNINELIRGLERFLSFFSRLFDGGEVSILDPGFYLETIPIIIDWNTVLMIGIFAVLCSVLASWIPARKAGRLKPMDLLRKST
ncbi:MAG: ABC transporter permease [Treponema sp.]|nr:ABC transporter permease [Treponema sp.]